MKQPEQLGFDYGELDAGTRAFVQERAAQIHQTARATAAGIVKIGQWLTEVKERLEHGKFLPWLKREFGWKQTNARAFMQVSRQFKSSNFDDLQIDVSALYLIAAQKTPEPIRAEAIHRLEMGEQVKHSTVKAVIAQYNETGDASTAVAKLFDAVKEAKQKEVEQKTALPSPAAARKAAIETGKHTLDYNGTYQPPMTVAAQADYRADWKRVGPIADFIRWAAASPDSAKDLIAMVKARHWSNDFQADQRRAAIELLKKFHEGL